MCTLNFVPGSQGTRLAWVTDVIITIAMIWWWDSFVFFLLIDLLYFSSKSRFSYKVHACRHFSPLSPPSSPAYLEKYFRVTMFFIKILVLMGALMLIL